MPPGRARLDDDARAAIEVSHLCSLPPEAIRELAVVPGRLPADFGRP